MQYALALAGDAAADLKDLEPIVGERVLDELDELARGQKIGLRPDADGCCVWDFAMTVDDFTHTVFLRLHMDQATHLLSLMGIFDHISPI